jgi:5-keto 4-deoxyuronate isomerase
LLALPTRWTRLWQLETYPQFKADYFLSRREIGIINIGGNGYITVDDERFDLKSKTVFTSGKGNRKLFLPVLIKVLRQNSFSSPALLTLNFQPVL